MRRRAEPQRRDPPYAPRLGGECGRGIAMGGASSLLLAAIAGASPAMALLAMLGGGVAGALIGVLLWSGSDAVPEDRVPPPNVG